MDIVTLLIELLVIVVIGALVFLPDPHNPLPRWLRAIFGVVLFIIGIVYLGIKMGIGTHIH